MIYELNENHSLKEMCVLSPLFIHMMNSSVSLARQAYGIRKMQGKAQGGWVGNIPKCWEDLVCHLTTLS